MTIKKKLKGKSGFTLAETLLAVLILLLVSTIVANGIPVARNVYNNVIVGANAQMLLSTAITALRNELGTAKDVEIKSETTGGITSYSVIYFNSERSAYSRIRLADDPAKIQVDPYIVKPVPGTAISVITGSQERDLVSYAASNKELYITYGEIERKKDATTGKYVDDIIVFKHLEVRRINDSTSVLTSLDELKIRLVPFADSEA